MNRVWAKRVGWSVSAALGWWALTRLLPRRSPLADKAALVTGGSRGLGLLIARELAKRGCRVALLARDPNELQRAARSLRDEGFEALPLVCDVADPKQVDRALAEMVEHFGSVDVVVNDAGIIQVAPLDTLARADFEQAMAINFWGTVNVTLAALRYMRRQRHGRIANITSIGGKVAVPHLLPYACAKFAAVGFSEGLRAELAGTGVKVTTVVPGLMRTARRGARDVQGQARVRAGLVQRRGRDARARDERAPRRPPDRARHRARPGRDRGRHPRQDAAAREGPAPEPDAGGAGRRRPGAAVRAAIAADRVSRCARRSGDCQSVGP